MLRGNKHVVKPWDESILIGSQPSPRVKSPIAHRSFNKA